MTVAAASAAVVVGAAVLAIPLWQETSTTMEITQLHDQ